MFLKNTIKKYLYEYPTLYGKSPIQAMEYMFFTNGNGLDWHKGQLIDPYKKLTKRMNEANEDKCYGDKKTWNRVKIYAKKYLSQDKSIYLFQRNPISMKSDINLISLTENLGRPIGFYHLDLGRYSQLGHLPNDIKDDWLSGAAKMLLYCLHYRQSRRIQYYNNPKNYHDSYHENNEYRQEENHAHALILLMRYEKKFGDRKAWRDVIDHPEFIAPYYKGAKFWNIRELRNERLLTLSCKCSLKDRKEDGLTENPFELLTTDEYLDYFEIDCGILTKEEKDLAKQIHNRSWMEKLLNLKKRCEMNTRLTNIKESIGIGKISKNGNLIIKGTPEVLEMHKEWNFILKMREERLAKAAKP
jgi:hypothetical protein